MSNANVNLVRQLLSEKTNLLGLKLRVANLWTNATEVSGNIRIIQKNQIW